MNGMVSCKNCSAQNSLDSTFCKRCGASLPDDEIQLAKEKLESVVADGYKIFSAGRTDEAMQIAETAVSANPTSTAALSLKAMCHERLGQVAEALECHERVLAIDPDSMIDKIKVNDLRNLLVARSSIASVPDRRMAIVGAVAAFVLVASIGVVIAKSGRGEPVASKEPVSNSITDPSVVRFDSPQFTAPGAATKTDANQESDPSTTANPNQNNNTVQTPPAAEANRGQQPERQNNPGPVLPPATAGNQLPNINGSIGGGAPNGVLTVEPSADLRRQMEAARQAAQNNNGNSAPTQKPNEGNDPSPEDVTPPAKQQAPGIMEITVVSGNGKTSGDNSGGDPSSRANGVEALLRTARNQYQVGEYASAATAYERALRAGADAGSGNQRLAQCYEKLGRNSDAVAAYGRASDAFQAQLDAGKGDKTRLSAAIDSCKQAIKVLGG